jgi:PKD repeat protein
MNFNNIKLLVFLVVFSGCSYVSHLVKTDNNKLVKLQTDKPDEALELEFQKTRDVITNIVPREKLLEARSYQQQLINRLNKAAIPGIVWEERGPYNVGGRTRAILWDKNDSTGKTVFAAGVSGGLWKTTNVFADEVSWTQVDDFLDNMAICAIAQDPLRPDTIYIGLGEGFSNVDAVQGNGIYRSIDGGNSFTPLASTITTNYSTCAGTGACNFLFVNKIVVTTSGTIIAACRSNFSTRGGIMRSTNFGASFTKIIPSATPFKGADLEIAANGDIYAALGLTGASSTDNGIWKSTNDGASFTKMYTANSSDRRIEIACAPSNSNFIYAITQNSSTSKARRVLRSSDAGTNWTEIKVPVTINGGDTFTNNQAWYNLLLSVDPNDDSTVIMGGIDIYKTTNGGTSWTQISEWTGANNLPKVHSDQHIASFRTTGSDTILIGNDGGLYLIKDFSSANPSFKDLNTGYNVTQFYTCALNPVRHSNEFLGGTQDNGTNQFKSAQMNTTVEVIGGDGGFCHIDSDNPTYQFGAYTNSNFYRSTNAGLTFNNFLSSGNGKFINPTDYDSKNNILYAGEVTGRYLRISNMTGTPSSTVINASFSGQVSAVTVDTVNANVVYFGTDAGKVYRVTNAHATPTVSDITPASMASGTYVTCITIDRKNTSHLLAIVSNYSTNSIFESTNSGSSWTVVDGNLPDMPVRWAIFSPLGGDSAIIATELGVWSTDNLNGGSTNWGTSNNGLANVRVDMIRMRKSDSLIIAATHGRGIFSSTMFASVKAGFESDIQLCYIGNAIQFKDDSYKATSWQWDFNNDGIIDATVKNPQYAYATSGLKTITLTINGSHSITRTNYIHVLPNMFTPYSNTDGGNFDSSSKAFHFGSSSLEGGINLWERGTPSNFLTNVSSGPNVWKTDLDADIFKGDYQCALYTPNFNFSNSGTYTISFDKSMEIAFCNAPIGVQVQYSTDNGLNWSRLGDSVGTNWYNRIPSSSCKMETAIFADRFGWIGNYNKSATSYNASSLAGNANVCFRIVLSVAEGYSNSGYTVDGFMVDNFQISGPTNSPTLPGIEVLISEQTLPLGSLATVDYFSNNGKYIATLKNNSTHDYGNTKVEIDNAGIGTTNFSTNTETSRRILNKTIKITPTNVNNSGDVDITMYFEKEEIDSFETTTGNSKSTLNLLKTPGALLSTGTISNTIYGNSPNGSNHLEGYKVRSNFTNGFSGLGAGRDGTSGPLPVSWLNFTAKRTNNTVSLNWQTASELNNQLFEVMRLIEGEKDFKVIGNVDGNGTTFKISKYNFTDNLSTLESSKNLYYQLKQVDYDGRFDMSKVIVLYPDKTFKNIAVYPNPGNNQIQIDFGNFDLDNASVEILDLSGKILLTTNLSNTNSVIKTDKLASGIYWLNLYQNGFKIGQVKWLKK